MQDPTKLMVDSRVLLENGEYGRVVFSTILGDFSIGHKEEEWLNIEKGVMIETEGGAWVFYPDWVFRDEPHRAPRLVQE